MDSARVMIVGCGHMGLAIVQGLLGVRPDRELVVVDIDPDRRRALAHEHGLSVTADLRISDGDLVVLAVPPQAFEDFVAAEGHKFSPETPVLSVMAGLTSSSIGRALGTSEVVRAIPNTPSEVFEGMSVYFAASVVSDETVARANELLSSIGKALRVDTEQLVDDATAICGGGPAFVSYILDAFCAFADSCGFAPDSSRAMAVQVFGGTAALVAQSAKPPMQLCHEVMTPNGTTERGIAAFDSAGVRGSIITALAASAQRSRARLVAEHRQGKR